MASVTDIQEAETLEIFRRHGGTLRTKEALALGIPSAHALRTA